VRLRREADRASIDAFRLSIAISAALVAAGGLLGLAIQNPRRKVKACDCPGGQLAGHPREAARHGFRAPRRVPAEAEA
jgi:hypothetical protein